jgi:hypothetical protein
LRVGHIIGATRERNMGLAKSTTFKISILKPIVIDHDFSIDKNRYYNTYNDEKKNCNKADDRVAVYKDVNDMSIS